MSTSPHTTTNERGAFELVIDAISNDRFLAYMERYTTQLASLVSPKYLNWLVASSEDENDSEAASKPAIASSEMREYTRDHYDAFTTYRSFFDSRLDSVFRNLAAARKSSGGDASDGCVTQENFFSLCVSVMAGNDDDRPSKHVESCEEAVTRLKIPARMNVGEGENQRLPSLRQMCQELLLMLDTASDFRTFAAMMQRVQLEILTEEEG